MTQISENVVIYTILNQWRRSVVKAEGSRSVGSSHQTRNRSKFVFGTENWLFVHFRLCSFSAEN